MKKFILIEIDSDDKYCSKCSQKKGIRPKSQFTSKGYMEYYSMWVCRAFKTQQNKPRKLRISKNDNKCFRCLACKKAERKSI
ncbi:MAG TPA: hypothetical protein VMX17_12585 [Candidatus Glassbacteria bacterium]|nr:hypothetical protein [Candidatus Glassbacteria bacterium]